MSDHTRSNEYILQNHKLLLEVEIELTGEAFPDYAAQSNAVESVKMMEIDDLEE